MRATNDSHPDPYNVTYFELGNEQSNPNFVAQVAAMEARAAAVGAPREQFNYLYPSNRGIDAADAAVPRPWPRWFNVSDHTYSL